MRGEQSAAESVERASTHIKIDTLDDGRFRATQRDVEIVGEGDNPARAVANFADRVARVVYEGEEAER